MKNKRNIGILAIVVGVLIAVVLIVFTILQSAGKTNVVVTNKYISKGQMITQDDLSVIQINKGDVKEDYILKSDAVVNQFAAVDIVSGDILSSQKVSNKATVGDNQFLSIPSGKQAISFSVKGGADSLSNKLITGDIIRVYTYDDSKNVYSPKELQFLQIANITSSEYKDVDEKTKEGTDEKSTTYSTITVIVDTVQAEQLIKIQREGGVYVTLISRGNDSVASQVLEKQESIIRGTK